jgi:hypothetical protein
MWNAISQVVASALIALAVLIIVVLVEAYFEVCNAPVRSRRQEKGADGGLSHRKGL